MLPITAPINFAHQVLNINTTGWSGQHSGSWTLPMYNTGPTIQMMVQKLIYILYKSCHWYVQIKTCTYTSSRFIDFTYSHQTATPLGNVANHKFWVRWQSMYYSLCHLHLNTCVRGRIWCCDDRGYYSVYRCVQRQQQQQLATRNTFHILGLRWQGNTEAIQEALTF